MSIAKTVPVAHEKVKARPAAPRRPRKNWKPVIGDIVKGRTVFVPDTELGDQGIKYLQLALKRRGRDERLRTERTIRGGIDGRLLRAVIGMDELSPVSAEVVE